MNVCVPSVGCGLDFSTEQDFDAHRVGRHDYTFAEGLKFEPPRMDGRRCIDEDELIAMGWEFDRHGRWKRPVKPNFNLERVEL